MTVANTVVPQRGAIDLLSRIASGTLTATEAVGASLDRCRTGRHLNAMIALHEDSAIGEARTVDRISASGGELGLLAGLPIIVKDNIAVGGRSFTGGSPALADHVAPQDASVVARLRNAGAIVIGKSNLHELAFGTTSNNAWSGPVRNPHDTLRICGGSSGGSAAAVTYGMATIALGTDTGGSGRIPAALCGCVGFRPTVGRYGADGVMLLTTTRDAISLTANCVDDILLVDQVITGDVPEDQAVLTALRLGIPAPFATDGLSPEVHAAFSYALDLLREAGVTLIPLDASELHDIDQRIGLPLVLAEATPLWRDYARRILDIDLETFAARLGSPDVRAVFETLAREGGPVPAETYAEMRDEALPRLKAAYARIFADAKLDALVFPTVVTTAPLIGEDDTLVVAGETLPVFPTMIRNVGPGSLAGFAGVSLPIPVAADQLPVGFAIDGLAGWDGRILAIAAAIERHFDTARAAS